MAEHPLQGLMTTAMENLKEMVDVNTIVGDPVETPDGSIIIPISRVGFGFAAGGTDFTLDGPDRRKGQTDEEKHGREKGTEFPFGGGSGGGVSITPVAFLVVGEKGIRLLNLDGQTHLLDRLIDFAPGLMERLQGAVRGRKRSEEPRMDI
ncbi:sporulation protein YtfJ [Planifilum fulgidum]|jgi:sporulation protein YtfJ|uniref:Sporulation protein YtfJ n=1 Tax=Planifilum fulgidum TaxID=201973 RepID=A0A1I2L5T5_9BACL|nr:GerW family sporulation protein [Planifilum fulgidum]MBO2495755.1 sporulation protein YtfJ [Bacillota bacterium]SFF74682.1 sporulation protein YtfJ [Planifilum fulgidum]